MQDSTHKLIHTFAALADLGQEIADTSNFEEMVRASLHLLLGALAIRRGAIAEHILSSGELEFVAARGVGNLGAAKAWHAALDSEAMRCSIDRGLSAPARPNT